MMENHIITKETIDTALCDTTKVLQLALEGQSQHPRFARILESLRAISDEANAIISEETPREDEEMASPSEAESETKTPEVEMKIEGEKEEQQSEPQEEVQEEEVKMEEAEEKESQMEAETEEEQEDEEEEAEEEEEEENQESEEQKKEKLSLEKIASAASVLDRVQTQIQVLDQHANEVDLSPLDTDHGVHGTGDDESPPSLLYKLVSSLHQRRNEIGVTLIKTTEELDTIECTPETRPKRKEQVIRAQSIEKVFDTLSKKVLKLVDAVNEWRRKEEEERKRKEEEERKKKEEEERKRKEEEERRRKEEEERRRKEEEERMLQQDDYGEEEEEEEEEDEEEEEHDPFSFDWFGNRVTPRRRLSDEQIRRHSQQSAYAHEMRRRQLEAQRQAALEERLRRQRAEEYRRRMLGPGLGGFFF